MGWRRSPAFLTLWLLILLYLSLLQILAGAGAASEPTLNSLADLVAVLNFLLITPAVAALACLSSLSGEPLAAFLLGFLTYSLSPFSWLRARPPYHIVMLAVSALWGLGCASLTKSKELGDLWALVGYAILFLTWWLSLGLVLD